MWDADMTKGRSRSLPESKSPFIDEGSHVRNDTDIIAARLRLQIVPFSPAFLQLCMQGRTKDNTVLLRSNLVFAMTHTQQNKLYVLSKILLGTIELMQIMEKKKKSGGVVKCTSVGIMRVNVWSSEAVKQMQTAKLETHIREMSLYQLLYVWLKLI